MRCQLNDSLQPHLYHSQGKLERNRFVTASQTKQLMLQVAKTCSDHLNHVLPHTYLYAIIPLRARDIPK